MKIVINTCYGGFELSEEAKSFLGCDTSDSYCNDRSNPKLVECVEKLGEKASETCSRLKVVEIPDGVDWEIGEYDGIEWIAEKHRTWR